MEYDQHGLSIVTGANIFPHNYRHTRKDGAVTGRLNGLKPLEFAHCNGSQQSSWSYDPQAPLPGNFKFQRWMTKARAATMQPFSPAKWHSNAFCSTQELVAPPSWLWLMWPVWPNCTDSNISHSPLLSYGVVTIWLRLSLSDYVSKESVFALSFFMSLLFTVLPKSHDRYCCL